MAHRQRGFSLIEITLGVTLLGLLSVAAAHMLTDSLSTARISQRSHAAAFEARYALARLSREIRGTHWDNDSQSHAITIALPTHMVFAKTGVSAPLDVEIQLVGQNLMLAYPPDLGPALLLDHVSALALDYRDASMLSTQDPAQIRFVRLQLTRTAPQTPPTSWQTLLALRGEP